MLVFSYSCNLEGKGLPLPPNVILSIVIHDIPFDNDFG